MAVQLRRYEVEPGRMEEVVAFWLRIAEVRRHHGFTIEFAYVDRENNEFVWAVSHPAWSQASETYESSPERMQVFADGPPPVLRAHVTMVEPLA